MIPLSLMRTVRSLADLLADIEERLFVEIPAAVRRGAKGWASPPWCCGLVFDGSQSPYLPPEIALTAVAEREAYLRKSASKTVSGRKHIWNCVAFEGINAGWFNDRKLLSACSAASELLEERDTALPASRLIVRVAKRLNALPLKSFGEVADEFAVYAFDRNEPATKLLAPSLTARKRAALERLRLL